MEPWSVSSWGQCNAAGPARIEETRHGEVETRYAPRRPELPRLGDVRPVWLLAFRRPRAVRRALLDPRVGPPRAADQPGALASLGAPGHRGWALGCLRRHHEDLHPRDGGKGARHRDEVPPRRLPALRADGYLHFHRPPLHAGRGL